jgi:hypothetical protein
MTLYEANIFHSERGPFISETVEDAIADIDTWGHGEGEVVYHTNSSAAKGYSTPQISYGFHTIYVRRVEGGEVIGKVTIAHNEGV